jgi:hypothetical protein
MKLFTKQVKNHIASSALDLDMLLTGALFLLLSSRIFLYFRQTDCWAVLQQIFYHIIKDSYQHKRDKSFDIKMFGFDAY